MTHSTFCRLISVDSTAWDFILKPLTAARYAIAPPTMAPKMAAPPAIKAELMTSLMYFAPPS
jgi:hypothetical protein